MGQNVINQTERQIGLLQFAAIFSVAVGITCFAILQMLDVKHTIPEAELQAWKANAPLVKSLGELGNRLIEYEQGYQTNSPQLPSMEARARQASSSIHTALVDKKKQPMLEDFKNILQMADHYMAFVRQSSSANLPEKMRLVQLSGEVERLKQQLDEQRQQNADLRTQLILCQNR